MCCVFKYVFKFEEKVQTNIMAVSKDTLLSFVEPSPYNPSYKVTDAQLVVHIPPLCFENNRNTNYTANRISLFPITCKNTLFLDMLVTLIRKVRAKMLQGTLFPFHPLLSCMLNM
jgi:hypothetical protein